MLEYIGFADEFNFYFMSKISSILLTSVLLAACSPQSTATVPSRDTEPVVEEAIEEIIVEEKRFKCPSCSPNEKVALEFLQDRGIKDKYALATVMGNIKQESKFLPNICEGGARVNYNQCHSGGYGLIQWTTANRYRGLGVFASRYLCKAEEMKCQLRYMTTEPQWIRASETFKTPGLSVDSYMNAAYYWLGWGIHGNRTYYTNQYVNLYTS